MLQVDLGNYFLDQGLGRQAVNRLMLESLIAFPIDVLHVGFSDLLQWDELRNGGGSTRLLSTNLRPLSPASGGPQPFVVVRIEGAALGLAAPFRIGFLGVTIPQRVKRRTGFRALEPIEALRAWRAESAGQADLWILLSDLPRESQAIEPGDPIHDLVTAFPEIGAVLLAEKRFVLYDPQSVGGTLVLSSVDRGRYLSWLEIRLDEKGGIEAMQGLSRQLGDGIVEDPAWRERQDALAAILR